MQVWHKIGHSFFAGIEFLQNAEAGVDHPSPPLTIAIGLASGPKTFKTSHAFIFYRSERGCGPDGLGIYFSGFLVYQELTTRGFQSSTVAIAHANIRLTGGQSYTNEDAWVLEMQG